jgi:hypothetical protein
MNFWILNVQTVRQPSDIESAIKFTIATASVRTNSARIVPLRTAFTHNNVHAIGRTDNTHTKSHLRFSTNIHGTIASHQSDCNMPK